MRTVTIAKPEVDHRVFISYVHDDRYVAEHIRNALARSGIRRMDDVAIAAGRDWTTEIREAIRASDVLLVLLSPAALAYPWIDAGIDQMLSVDLDRRGVELIPVLAAPTEMPAPLRNRPFVDLTENLTAGLNQLVQQVKAAAQIDFSLMTPESFEKFVADLLRAVGFRVGERRRGPESGVDLRATYERTDPFGSPETEVWLVEAKLYSHARVSVDAIRNLAGAVALASGVTRGLLVTNVQLTSVARGYVEKLEQTSHVRLRVLDGIELRNLLRRFPAVAARHFGSTTKPGSVPDGDS